MKNPFKTGRLITDRLIGKVLAFCLICMAILLPTFGAYVSLRNGYNRQNALAEQTRDRGYKILEKCNSGWREVDVLKEDMKSALSVASRLKCPEYDDLLALWEECKRDTDCKRKDSRVKAQKLSSSVKIASDTYRKAKDQIKSLKNLIDTTYSRSWSAPCACSPLSAIAVCAPLPWRWIAAPCWSCSM